MQVLTQRRTAEDRPAISVLETVDMVSGHRTVLTEFPFLIEAPNWSSDGQSLIYNSRGRIFRYDLVARTSHPVDSRYCDQCNNDHVLSPDGRALAVSHHTAEDGQSRIYRIPLEGGAPVLVTPLAPSYLHGWSPDGLELAYCAERNGEYDIYTIAAEGGVETRLTTAEGLNDGPEYSPSGRHIWFNSVRTGLMQIWRMNRDGSDQVRMTQDEDNCWFPHLSPDGKTVAYVAYRKGDVQPGDHPPNKDVEIRLMSSDGGPGRPLVKLFGGQGTLNVNSWSPDGARLAFVSYRLP